MMQNERSQIRRKVLIVALIPAATVTLLLTLVFSISHTRGLEQSQYERGVAIIRQLAPASEYGVFSGNQNILASVVDAVKNEADVRSIVVRSNPIAGELNNDTPVNIRNDSEKVKSINPKTILVKYGPEMHRAGDLNISADVPIAATADNELSIIFQAPIFQTEFAADNSDDMELVDSDTSIPELRQTERILGWVNVELSMQRTHAFQMNTWRNSAFIAVVVLLLSSIIAIRMGRSITVPITQLKDAVHELESGNLEININTGAGGELGALESGINTMAKALKTSHAQLEERVQQATVELRNTLHILEQRNLELDTARSEAEFANQSKSDFLATISHEIRTPINGIQGFLLLLAKTNLSSSQLEFIDKIDISTKTLLTLLNDILDFSKLEAAKLSINPSEFEFRKLVQNSIDICVPDAHHKGLDVFTIIDADVPGRINADEDRIAQIIKNLVSNAVKFTQQGRIIIHISVIEKTASNHTLQFTVSDTGIGIAKQDQAQLFEPFSQIEAGMARRYNGTGLGLVITKSLTELMRGSITVDSTPEQGSTFTVRLPVIACPELKKGNELKAALKNRHVLVVTNEPYMNKSLQQSLQYWQIGVEAVSDIKTANEYLSRLKISQTALDAVVIDGMLNNTHIEHLRRQILSSCVQPSPELILIQRTNILTPDSTSTAFKKNTDAMLRLSRPVYDNDLANTLYRAITKKTAAADVEPGETGLSKQEIACLQRLRILVADDNPVNRLFLSTWLNALGATIDEVADGNEAVHQCTHNSYDLILMDLHMPKLDGLQAATRIRECYALSNTPIIAITADATDNTKRLVQESVLDDYIIKPIAEQELLRVLRKWCISPGTAQFDRMQHSNGLILVEDMISAQTTQTKSEENDIIDEVLGLRLASGNYPLWHSSLRMLADKLAQQQSALDAASTDNDYPQLAEISHSIVGAASYCGAIGLQHAASDLEATVQSRNLADTQPAYRTLRREIARFEQWVSINMQNISSENDM